MPNEKTPLTLRLRRRSKDWYLSCVLSIGTCLGFLLWFVFAQDRGQVLKQPLLAATPQTDTPEHEMTAEDILPVGLSQEFSLKHIFHHGSGKYNRVHRRLDITPKFLEQYSDQLETPLTPDEVKESSLHDAVSSMDWPNSMRDENPWTVLLHVRERARRAK